MIYHWTPWRCLYTVAALEEGVSFSSRSLGCILCFHFLANQGACLDCRYLSALSSPPRMVGRWQRGSGESRGIKVSRQCIHNKILQANWGALHILVAGRRSLTKHLFSQARNYIQSLSYMPKMNFENVFIGANPLGKGFQHFSREGDLMADIVRSCSLIWRLGVFPLD